MVFQYASKIAQSPLRSRSILHNVPDGRAPVTVETGRSTVAGQFRLVIIVKLLHNTITKKFIFAMNLLGRLPDTNSYSVMPQLSFFASDRRQRDTKTLEYVYEF
jgi:hypothetical protein